MTVANIKQLTDRILNEAEKLDNEVYLLSGIVHCLLRRIDQEHITISNDEWSNMLFDHAGYQKRAKGGVIELWLLKEKETS